ncbi:MAG: type II toxin-antitoxin system RelE family toxin [Burkholderiales bacterium]
MTWEVRVDRDAEWQLLKLDRPVQRRIIAYLRDRIAGTDNPRRLRKALRGPQKQLWRYRVGDYRLVCDIEDDAKTVLVLLIAHRREAYR